MILNRPTPLAPIFENFPVTLIALPNWVLWRYTLKDNKWTKVPFQTNGNTASSTNPATWNSFDSVRAAYQLGNFDGVGIVLPGKPLDNGSYLIGLDFDHCLAAGVLNEGPRRAVDLLNTYCEISPSGEGIRLFFLHDKTTPACKSKKTDGNSREIYSTGRYLTVTGRTFGQRKEVRHVA